MGGVHVAALSLTSTCEWWECQAAHFGGAIAGFLICIVVGKNRAIRNHECVLRLLALLLGLGLVLFCLAWGMSWAPHDIFDPVRWCWARQVISPSAFGDQAPHR